MVNMFKQIRDAAEVACQHFGRAIASRAAANAGWLVADKLLRLCLGLFVNVWVARHLGPDLFGTLNYGQSLFLTLLPIATLGLNDLLMRDFVRFRHDSDAISASAIVLRTVASVGSLLIAVVLVNVLRPNENKIEITSTIICFSFFFLFSDILDVRLQSSGKFRSVTIVRMFAFLISCVLKLIAIFADAGVYVFAILIVFEFAMITIGVFSIARRNRMYFDFRMVSLDEMRRQLKSVIYLLIRLIAIALYMRTDILMLGSFMGNQAVGVYAAATRISEVYYLIPMSVMTAASPRFNHLYISDRREYEIVFITVTRSLVVLAVVAGIVCIVASQFIIDMLYGDKFVDSASVLTIHIWAGLFVSLGVPASNWFLNSENLSFALFQAILGAILCIALNYLLIPTVGVTAPAYSLLISQFVSSFLFNALFKSTRRVFLLQVHALLPFSSRWRWR